MFWYEVGEWWKDVCLAVRVYGFIRRSEYWSLDGEGCRFEVRWRAGRRRGLEERLREHRLEPRGVVMEWISVNGEVRCVASDDERWAGYPRVVMSSMAGVALNEGEGER